MTGAATGQHLGARNLVFLRQLLTFLGLVVFSGWPIHLEDLAFRPDEQLGLPMTLKAPLHLQRSSLISEGHQVNTPVTGRAAHTLVHVDAVIEINEVGQIVNAGPPDRLARPPALAYRLQIRAVRPNLRVAVHAGFGGWDPGIRELFNGCVAVATIDRLIADVMFMAELYRLFSREESLSVVRRPVELEQHPDNDPDKENRSEDGGLRYEVGASIEDLSHRLPTAKRRGNLRAQKPGHGHCADPGAD